MRTNGQSSALASEKYNYMRALQLNIREDGLRLMANDTSPLLPEMEEFLLLPPPFEETAALPALPVTESGDVVTP
jgi:general secretion pathway protein D